jgi:hypothetical protein
MISVEEHESIIKRISNHYESTISRLTNDISKYKSTISNLKETQKQIKRRAQDDIRDVMKQYKGSGSGKRPKNTTPINNNASSSTLVPPQTKHDIKWYNRYEELKSYKDKHGHCNVDPKESKDLWQWCQTQRTNYSHLVKGHETTTMTPERLKLLNAIRFEFVKSKTPGT